MHAVKEFLPDAVQRLFNREDRSPRAVTIKRVRQLLPAMIIAVVLVIVGRLRMLGQDQTAETTDPSETSN
jgi:peptidoglycan/LPS O-acetylase OafA/YrhL